MLTRNRNKMGEWVDEEGENDDRRLENTKKKKKSFIILMESGYK